MFLKFFITFCSFRVTLSPSGNHRAQKTSLRIMMRYTTTWRPAHLCTRSGLGGRIFTLSKAFWPFSDMLLQGPLFWCVRVWALFSSLPLTRLRFRGCSFWRPSRPPPSLFCLHFEAAKRGLHSQSTKILLGFLKFSARLASNKIVPYKTVFGGQRGKFLSVKERAYWVDPSRLPFVLLEYQPVGGWGRFKSTH